MSVKSKLRNALDAIERAERKLKKASLEQAEDLDLARAIRELHEAKDGIEYAIRQVEN